MGGDGSGGKRKGAGRPAPDPAIKARALELAAATSPEEAVELLAAEGVRVSARSLRYWQQGQTGAKRHADGSLPVPKDAPSAAAPPAPVADRPPAGLSPRALYRWHVERRIDAVGKALAIAEDGATRGVVGAMARIAPLNDQLRKWLETLNDLDAAAPAEDPEAADERWRAEGAAVVAKVEAGVAAVEARIAKERAEGLKK